jgi:3-isopropylmalate/(R)-2-methylmalate dehydratase large subunit
MGRTLANRIWDDHVVAGSGGGPDVLYIDLHLLHEVSSPQAFDGLRLAGRGVRRPDLTLATMDHNIPTTDRSVPNSDPASVRQLEALRENCRQFGIPLLDLLSPDQGIVHMIGPELGLTQPGMTIACSDSHTPTHGAFGAIGIGIGTSDAEHVLATQCLSIGRPQDMLVDVRGRLGPGITAKDLILGIIREIGIDGGRGAVMEFRGPAIDALSMEGRMTICNMTSEAGARSGIVAVDETTVNYLRGRPFAPSGADWDAAVAQWRTLRSDDDATYDLTVVIDAASLEPTVTWGTTPAMSVSITERVPRPEETRDPDQTRRALAYMGLAGGEHITDLRIDRVFIGSCTNARIEDLRAAAAVIGGRRVASGVSAMVVPGSMAVKAQAQDEGLHEVFLSAGFEWREPGCSMCLGMNPDILRPGERCASTSNRNFEGRQGAGGRTHLVSPEMAALAAVHGRFVDVRQEAAGSGASVTEGAE